MTVFRRNQKVLSEVMDRRALLIDGQGTELIQLNPVGTAVWEALDGRRGVEAINGELAVRFPDVDPAGIAADVDAFLLELHGLGLIEEVLAPPAVEPPPSP